MNFSDSEIVASILQKIGYETTRDIKLANLILINTCSIKKAEQTVRKRLIFLEPQKKRDNYWNPWMHGGEIKK